MPLARRATPPSFTKSITGDQDQKVAQDPSSGKAATTNVNRGDGDIRISGHDLVADGDFVIPDDVSGVSAVPFIGGGTQSILGVESKDSNQFSVTFEYGTVGSDGSFTTDFTYDKNDDANLDSDSSYVIRVAVIRDRVKVTLSDTSGGAQNNIQGGFNSH